MFSKNIRFSVKYVVSHQRDSYTRDFLPVSNGEEIARVGDTGYHELRFIVDATLKLSNVAPGLSRN